MAAAIVLIIAAASLLIPHAGYYLTLRNKDSGELYARYRMDEGDRFSITFKHSVNQYPLTDTFEISEGKIYAEECKYYAYGAGVQVELNPGEELSYTDDGAMLITGIHQDRTGVCYAVATVYDFFLKVKDGPDTSLRDLCGRNSLVTLNYEFFLY
jgi:domain of unknown function (DUF1850)